MGVNLRGIAGKSSSSSMRQALELRVRSGQRVCLIAAAVCACGAGWTSRAQAQVSGGPNLPGTGSLDIVWQQAAASAPQVAGQIQGTVVDATGTPVVGARVKLTLANDATQSREVVSDEEGHFVFAGVAPGAFQLAATAEGFALTTTTGTLRDDEQNYVVAPMTLMVAGTSSEVRVTMTRTDIAEAEIKDEEKQRVLGVVPNFYVTYNPAALPLNTKQKFELAWKATIDPVNIALVGATAGIQQATDSFSGYGQGAQGYGKRYGASYADLVTGTFIGGAILPAMLKQDPRYFYKGNGTVRERLWYAIRMAVICKGDNGKWQPNYSGILGGLAAGGISNLYYPSTDRGVELTFENTAIGIGTTAAANVLQEFLIRKLTPHAPSYAPTGTATP
jgi:hypothetical protein